MAKMLKRGLSLGSATALRSPVRRRLSVTSDVRKAAKALGIEAPTKRMTQADLDALCAAVIEKTSAAGPVGEAVAVKALSRSADATFAELHAERDARIDAAVKDAIKTGRLPLAVEADVKALLGVRHGYALSAKGEASAVDVRAAVEKILAALPADACVPLTERIKKQNLSAAGGQPAPDAAPFDANKEVSDRLARMKARGLSK